MAFFIHSITNGAIPALEYLPASAFQPKAGMALVLSSGKLAAADGAVKPAYISMLEAGAALTAGKLMPVFRVSEDIIFETAADGAITGAAAGSLLSLSDGEAVCAPDDGDTGTAEVVALDGTADGSRVLVRFN